MSAPAANEKCSTLERSLISELNRFGLLEAIFGRRARRFAVGMSVPDGPLKFESKHPPQPLSAAERTILVLCGAGISGWNFGLPHTTTSPAGTGCNYPVRLVGRTYPSAAGIHASELLFTDDSGAYITQFRDLAPERLQELQSAADFDTLVERTARHIVKIGDARVTLPKQFPHIESHNFWTANQPGTTLFVPVVDLAQQTLDGLAILLGEQAVPYDAVHDRYCGNLEPFIRSGLLDDTRRVPLADFEQYLLATAVGEITAANYNIVLVLQAMGLGGWLYSGINPLSLLGAAAADGIPGFGFRCTTRADWSTPNPVGLDGLFEGFCPPYVADMRAAAAKLIERKFGAGGTYDPTTAGPYRDNARVKQAVARYQPQFVECLGEVADYIHATFGKFPATAPSMYARLYAQAQHIDTEFYDEHFGPGAYLATHAEHERKWHAH
ncbi:MAG: hypothetical protein K2Y37_15515 [Pirellulales bacterium]|nr:hypothetical protein [Pirellulales bacterium]